VSRALITGASAGIGACFARALARRRYDLILVARRLGRLEALARELEEGFGVRAEALPADLTAEADLARVRERIGEAELDLLINNAGFGAPGRFWETDLAVQDSMHRLHVIATVQLTHAALRGMTARNRGAIINVSSVAGFAQGGSTSYSATKAWMNSFTEGLYLELKRAGSPVRVQALCPGFTYSEFHDVARMDRSLVPKSWWMEAEEVVAASLAGLERGELFVVPGLRYKALVKLIGIVPGGLRRAGALLYARRRRM
jgi:short-subunit dehydrogenase